MKYLLYCILRTFETREPLGLVGVDSQPVFLISNNGLSAATSMINQLTIAPNISWLLAYKKVIESFYRDHTVIPMRYGCVLDQESQIIQLLEKNRMQYYELLMELGDCVEMGMRILISDFGMRTRLPRVAKHCGQVSDSAEKRISKIANPWPRPGMPGASDGRTDMEQQQKQENIQITSHQGGRKSKIATPGHAYLDARRTRYAQQERFTKEMSVVTDRYREAFAGLFLKCKEEYHAIRTLKFLSLYFLLPRSSVDLFRKVFRRISMKESAKLLLSGPWPPYNFVQAEHTHNHELINLSLKL